MILGVSDWLAGRINMQAPHIRIGFVITFLLGFGILLYLILFVVMTLEKNKR
jgi:phage shock protein PspC (stress-responsive transcriptional regulator)